MCDWSCFGPLGSGRGDHRRCHSGQGMFLDCCYCGGRLPPSSHWLGVGSDWAEGDVAVVAAIGF